MENGAKPAAPAANEPVSACLVRTLWENAVQHGFLYFRFRPFTIYRAVGIYGAFLLVFGQISCVGLGR